MASRNAIASNLDRVGEVIHILLMIRDEGGQERCEMDIAQVPDDMAVVVLAAGRGARLRPLTDSIPKPLCPIAGHAMVDWVIDRIPVEDSKIAINAHYLADQIVDHFQGRDVHVSVEPRPLGSAGAIGNLSRWIDGRDVLIHNADAWLDGDLADLWASWDRKRPRLLVTPTGRPSDFGDRRFVGASLLPAGEVARLFAAPSSLYESVWAPLHRQGSVEFITFSGIAIDCGTWPDYELANRLGKPTS